MALIPDNPHSVTPFDMGAPPPELPEGTTGMPSVDMLIPPVTYSDPAPVDNFVFGGGSDAPSPEQLAEIRKLPHDTQEFILAWWPHCWNRPSPYIDGKVVLTLAALQMHAEGYMRDANKPKRGRPRKKDQTADSPRDAHRSEPDNEHDSAAYKAWQADCAARKQWIEEKNAEWRRRVAARKEALANWDAYVEEAREAFRNAAATPAPERPK